VTASGRATPAAVYEQIGRTYARTRRADRRIATRIIDVLGAARSVLNIGAGTGNYEPRDRSVVALEPSPVMLEQRDEGSAPAVRGTCDALPFADGTFDAAMALLTVHHWVDLAAGFAEMRRVSARQVILAFERSTLVDFWLADYFPEMRDIPSERRAPHIDQLVELLGGAASVEPVPVPADCTDGFAGAFWNHPERYLEPEVQRNTSNLAQLAPSVLARGSGQLRADLDSGAWDRRYGSLRELDEYEMGYRLVVA
jgi:SAM-dependent methyltransferase